MMLEQVASIHLGNSQRGNFFVARECFDFLGKPVDKDKDQIEAIGHGKGADEIYQDDFPWLGGDFVG
jgi:hypothetical protein